MATERKEVCDLLVIGSGASGLAGALVAAHLELRVIVAEKSRNQRLVQGMDMAPCNQLARRAGIHLACRRSGV